MAGFLFMFSFYFFYSIAHCKYGTVCGLCPFHWHHIVTAKGRPCHIKPGEAFYIHFVVNAILPHFGDDSCEGRFAIVKNALCKIAGHAAKVMCDGMQWRRPA